MRWNIYIVLWFNITDSLIRVASNSKKNNASLLCILIAGFILWGCMGSLAWLIRRWLVNQVWGWISHQWKYLLPQSLSWFLFETDLSFFQPCSVHGWTSAFLPDVRRLCGAIEGRLGHFLPRWIRAGWQAVIRNRLSFPIMIPVIKSVTFL